MAPRIAIAGDATRRAPPGGDATCAAEPLRALTLNTLEPDFAGTTTQVKAILARTLRELEQVIDNADITSFLRGLGRVLS